MAIKVLVDAETGEKVLQLSIEELRDCFEAGFLNCRWGDDNTFDQWLAKQLKEATDD